MHETELKEQKTIKEELESSYREDYPVSEYMRGSVKVKAHTRGEGKKIDKSNYRLDQEQIEYYDKKIQEARTELREARKEHKEAYKLHDFENNLKKQKEIKKYRVFENRLFYDYPIDYNDYIRMVEKLSKTTIWLRNFGFFEGKRVSSYDENIGQWDIQASLTSHNMRELSGGIKKSWRRARWRYLPNETDEDISSAPYIYEVKGKKYLAHNTSDLKKYIKH